MKESWVKVIEGLHSVEGLMVLKIKILGFRILGIRVVLVQCFLKKFLFNVDRRHKILVAKLVDDGTTCNIKFVALYASHQNLVEEKNSVDFLLGLD